MRRPWWHYALAAPVAAAVVVLAVLFGLVLAGAAEDVRDVDADVHRTPMGDGTVCYVVVNGKGDPRGIDCLRTEGDTSP